VLAARGDWNARYGRGTENEAEIVLIDFQFFGVGNPAWELTYFLLLSATDPKHDDMLLMEYHSQLTERGGESQSSCII
jgi:thiamine kinase-like enzyme